MREAQARSIVAYLQKARAGGSAPAPAGEARTAALVLGNWCGNCHVIDGDGVEQGPDLTHAGKEHDAAWLRAWISDPAEVDELTDMPAFNDKLSPEELTAVANYLAARK
jgi:mono/diheme cytochrome c family protein